MPPLQITRSRVWLRAATRFQHVDVPINDVRLDGATVIPPQFWCVRNPATGREHLFTLLDPLPAFIEAHAL